MPRNTSDESNEGLVVGLGELEVVYEIFDADALGWKSASYLLDRWKGNPLRYWWHFRHRRGCTRRARSWTRPTNIQLESLWTTATSTIRHSSVVAAISCSLRVGASI